ncbi:hypothetical protein [Lactobacillus delbrueckii]|uniref:hypothetical protein n=1 Tax=Lactobacillus delbrueckii TaxID=1584 RepID=UPI0006813649|nr:hypothetical protein [Lactobacillus delbrueckii]APP03571.1 hypothetical protein LI610_09180 [Lactobacillus delbrueckii subsp. indicus]KNE29996.1 hypothetical protein LDI10_08270 [Lactobacillus delbrueckii subsp. indicus]
MQELVTSIDFTSFSGILIIMKFEDMFRIQLESYLTMYNQLRNLDGCVDYLESDFEEDFDEVFEVDLIHFREQVKWNQRAIYKQNQEIFEIVQGMIESEIELALVIEAGLWLVKQVDLLVSRLSYCETAVISDRGVPDMWDDWERMADGYAEIAIGQDELLEKMKGVSED